MRLLHSIFPKLFISFLLLSAIPLAILGSLTYRNISETLNEKLNQDAYSILEQKSIALSSFVNDLERMGHSIAASSTVSDFLKNTNRDDYILFFRKLDELIQSIHLIRPENIGITIASSHGFVYYFGYSYNHDIVNFGQFNWLSHPDAAPSELSFISSFHPRPYSNLSPDQMAFSYVRKLSSFNSKATGMLVIDFHTDLLNQLLGPGLAADSEDEQDEPFGIFVKNQHEQILYPLTSVPPTTGNLKWDNPEQYKLIHHLDPATQWTITAYFLKEKFYEPITKIQTSTILISIACVFICFIASFYISRKISHPIHGLTLAMERVGQGDFNAHANIQRKDELGTLGVGFNHMVKRIRDLIDLVYLEQNDKRRAEVAAMQAQIKPHFIYNTLETINAMARKKNETEISKLIVLLGKLLRMSISTFGEVIPMSKELEYVQYYLEIHKFRQRKLFEYDMIIDPGLQELYTLKWILQPVIENAIIHGLDPKQEGGKIEIRGWSDGEKVMIQIKDQGVGMKYEELKELQFNLEHLSEHFTKQLNKVGLYNVQSRIRLHYGKSYGIHLESVQGEGMTVTITLPRRTTNESI